MYVLSLRTTRGGTYSVDRSEWEEFPGPGDWCRMNVRAVGWRFASREAAGAWAARYVASHPGHTRDPAAALSSTGPRPSDPKTTPDAAESRAKGQHRDG